MSDAVARALEPVRRGATHGVVETRELIDGRDGLSERDALGRTGVQTEVVIKLVDGQLLVSASVASA